MMRSRDKKAFADLENYLIEYDLVSIAKDSDFASSNKGVFRRLLPLFIWHAIITKSRIWPKEEEKEELYKLYFSEALSDVAQAYILGVQGFSKPSRLILRSAVENYIRCVGIANDQAVLSVTVVRELFNIVQELPIVKSGREIPKQFASLRQLYTNLCNYSHTSSPDFMSLQNFLGRFPIYERMITQSNFDDINLFCVASSGLNCVQFKKLLFESHADWRDTILDVQTRRVKSEIAEI